jgi:hypothetical protein
MEISIRQMQTTVMVKSSELGLGPETKTCLLNNDTSSFSESIVQKEASKQNRINSQAAVEQVQKGHKTPTREGGKEPRKYVSINKDTLKESNIVME